MKARRRGPPQNQTGATNVSDTDGLERTKIEEAESPTIDIDEIYIELKPFFEKWEKFIAGHGYSHAISNFTYWRSRLIDDYPTHTKHEKENTNKLTHFQAIFDRYLDDRKSEALGIEN